MRQSCFFERLFNCASRLASPFVHWISSEESTRISSFAFIAISLAWGRESRTFKYVDLVFCRRVKLFLSYPAGIGRLKTHPFPRVLFFLLEETVD